MEITYDKIILIQKKKEKENLQWYEKYHLKNYNFS